MIIKLLKSGASISDHLTQAIKKGGVSLPQFNVLRILRGQKGEPANLSTVQERMVNKMSNTSRLVDKLIEKDLVERKICEENRRKIELFITSKGLSLLKKLDPLIDNEEEKMTQNLTVKDRNQLIALLEKLNVN
ncbi:MAG: MarR family winged helix-turn-helix transcriptional regulator [Flavobacteriaceae bacterium]